MTDPGRATEPEAATDRGPATDPGPMSRSRPPAPSRAALPIDVALLPSAAEVRSGRVLVVVDQIRASTTIVTALDLGCVDLRVTGDVVIARELGRTRGYLLAGEQHTRKPAGFDFDNSPSELSRVGIDGRGLVLCTTNGTATLDQLRDADLVLVGCLRNATAVATAAVELAMAAGSDGAVQVVCAGSVGRFVLDDAFAAGAIVERARERAAALGRSVELSDGARVATWLRARYPDSLAAMDDSEGGRTLRRIERPEDIAFCAQEDASETVPYLLAGEGLRIAVLEVAPGHGEPLNGRRSGRSGDGRPAVPNR